MYEIKATFFKQDVIYIGNYFFLNNPGINASNPGQTFFKQDFTSM